MFSRIISRIDDFINPIVVKEVRQSINGRTMMGTTMLFLTVQLVVLAIFFLDSKRLAGKGDDLFVWILGILLYACVFGVATTASMRFSRECAKNSMDLMYTTVIKPYKIISGKVFSAMVMVIYLFSMSVPFLCVAYFLRGISIPVVVFWVYLMFMIMIPVVTFAIALGSIPLSIIIRGIIFIGALWGIGAFFISLKSELRYGSLTDIMGFWPIFWLTIIPLIIAAGLFVISVAGISHSASNRLMPLRIYTLILWLGSLVFIIGCLIYENASGRQYQRTFSFWYVFITFCLTILVCTSTAERLEQTVRVRKKIPRIHLLRPLYFLLSTGAVNNCLFCLVLLVLTTFISGFFIFTAKDTPRNMEMFTCMLGITFYGLFYAGLTTFIRNKMKKIFPGMIGFIYFMVLSILLTFIPLLIAMLAFLDFQEIERSGGYFFILSPASLAYDDTRNLGMIVAIVGFLITIGMNFRYYANYFKASFTPPPINSGDNSK